METASPYTAEYRSAYSDGRHAGAEGVGLDANPHKAGTLAAQGWEDGHFDARSAKAVARDRFSVGLWRG